MALLLDEKETKNYKHTGAAQRTKVAYTANPENPDTSHIIC